MEPCSDVFATQIKLVANSEDQSCMTVGSYGKDHYYDVMFDPNVISFQIDL